MSILGDIDAHLATAQAEMSPQSWAVLSSEKPSLQTFALYGQRFGGIEPHFKDYKSAAFDVQRSGVRNAPALSTLVMLLDCASLIAVMLGRQLTQMRGRRRLDWHSSRGLSFLQLGLRELARLAYQRLPLPTLNPLPKRKVRPAVASRRKREALERQVQFSKVVRFSV